MQDDVTNIAQKSLLADEKEDVPIGVGLVVWKIPVQTYFLTSLLVLLTVNIFNVKSDTTASGPEDKRKDMRDSTHNG